MSFSRRRFLAALATASQAPRLFAQSPAILSTTDLGHGFSVIHGAGINVVSLKGPDGLLVIDGGLAEHSDQVVAALGSDSIRVLFNTHWHREATGLNQIAAESGAKIIAHENTRLWLNAGVNVRWQERRYEPLPKAWQPNDTFYKTTTTTFAKQPVEAGYMLQAHTDGDIYVFFPEANILVTGDVVAADSYPVLDYETGGWVNGLSDGHSKLLEVANEQTKIIPGTGPVMSYAELQKHAEIFATLRDTFIGMIRKGMTPAEMVEAKPTAEYDTIYGHPDQFVNNAYWGLWAHVREIGGIV